MLGHRKLEVADYLAILKRRRWLLLSFVVVFTIAGYVTTRFIPARYMSQTLVLIEQQRVSGEIVTPVITQSLDSRLSSMKEQMLSRSRIQPIIERYNLYANTHMNMDDRVDTVRKGIEIKPIHSAITGAGGLPGFFISFTTSDAHTAQLVCGEITNMFIDTNLQDREFAANGTQDFLKGQLADAKRSLDEQDAKLADFQRLHNGNLPGEDAPNLQIITSLNSQLEATNQAIAQLEQSKIYDESLLAQQTQPVVTSSSGATTAAQVQDPVYQQKLADLQKMKELESNLLTHYTPDYPDVIQVRRQIAELQKSLVAPAPAAVPGVQEVRRPDSAAVQQLRARIRATDIGIDNKRKEQDQLQASIRLYQGRISASPAIEEDYKALTRDYNTAQKFYDDLLAKSEQVKMTNDLEKRQGGETFKVMDPPNLPDAPTYPKVSLFVMGGLGIGLVLALAISALLEYRDTALRTERDVWAFTRLPTLAIISVAGEIPSDKPKGSLFSRFRRPPPVPTDKPTLSGAHG